MRCPYCKKDLQKGEFRRCETLPDHVLHTNAIPPFSRTLICECSPDSFWDYMGYIYISRYEIGHFGKAAKYGGRYLKKPKSALGSFARHMDRIHARRRFYQRHHIYWLVKLTRAVWLGLKSLVLLPFMKQPRRGNNYGPTEIY